MANGDSRHLPGAFDHACGVVLGQVDVDTKTNEVPMFTTLRDGVNLPVPLPHLEHHLHCALAQLLGVQRSRPWMDAALARPRLRLG
jgi:hypothetical protein